MITLLCAHMMIKCVGKIPLLNSEPLLRKLQKTRAEDTFCLTLYIVHNDCNVVGLL